MSAGTDMFVDPRLPWLLPAKIEMSPEEIAFWRRYDEACADSVTVEEMRRESLAEDLAAERGVA